MKKEDTAIDQGMVNIDQATTWWREIRQGREELASAVSEEEC